MALDGVTATGSLILNPLLSLWASFINVLPGIVAAIIILILGYFVALGLGHLVRIVLEKAGLNDGWAYKSQPCIWRASQVVCAYNIFTSCC